MSEEYQHDLANAIINCINGSHCEKGYKTFFIPSDFIIGEPISIVFLGQRIYGHVKDIRAWGLIMTNGTSIEYTIPYQSPDAGLRKETKETIPNSKI